MSRSYRRPYSSVCGKCSAHQDKTHAARGVRRKQNAWLKTQWYEEEMGVVPHRVQCKHNDTCDWSRDGDKFLRLPRPFDWETHQEVVQGLWEGNRWAYQYEGWRIWPPEWFQRLKRK